MPIIGFLSKAGLAMEPCRRVVQKDMTDAVKPLFKA